MSTSVLKSIVGCNFSNTFQSNPVSDQDAASLIHSINVNAVKMFTYHQTDFFEHARAAGLQVLVNVPNHKLSDLAKGANGSTLGELLATLNTYSDTIVAVCVGNEPLGSWWNGEFNGSLVPAITELYTAISAAGMNTKVTVPFNYAIMGQSYPPSAGSFNGSLEPIIKDVANIIQKNDSFFMVNIYPYLTRLSNPVDVKLDYCLFTAGQEHWVPDGQYTYKNLFDACYDALFVALGNLGYGNLPIVVGECGWPTAGGNDASVDNAKTFNQNLINHCLSGHGTPRNPGVKIPTFVFELYDENNKSTDPGAFELHWGVYDASGNAKYALSWK